MMLQSSNCTHIHGLIISDHPVAQYFIHSAFLFDMDLEHEGSDSSGTSWIDWFLSLKGNEFFCDVDEEYIMDRFNLAGLNNQVKHYTFAYDLITDALDQELDANTWDEVEKSARHLYGLIHARYILTSRGLAKMAEKMKNSEFGQCPRVLCYNQSTLPLGLSDIPGTNSVKIYCPRCEDVYNPVSRRHTLVDGSYFGTTMAHLLLQMFPQLSPYKAQERYIPRIFGFRIRSISAEHEKQDMKREEQLKRLQDTAIEE